MTPLDQPSTQSEPAPEEENFGELEVAEYLVFLLALDTYMRYLEEHHGVGAEDDLSRRGTQLIRMADRQHMEVIRGFMDSNLPSVGHKRMLGRAFANLPTHDGLGKRTLKLRTLLSIGGASTMRAVFKSNKALKEARDAMAAAAIDDADAALDKFAVIPMHNQRLRKWIDTAAETAGSGTFQNPTAAVAGDVSGDLPEIYAANNQHHAAPNSEEGKSAGEERTQLLTLVQAKATETASRAMQVSGEPDVPPNRSEVVGLAAAAVASAMSDPDIPANVPLALKGLDPEQTSAALTNGKVLVAAGAGAGKSTTVVARVTYLVKERGVNPSRILVTSFNTKAANELKQKIGTALGGETLNQMSVGTTHKLFRRFISEYGTPAERSAMGRGFVKGGGSVARAVQRIFEECEPPDEESRAPKRPKLKKCQLAKTKWFADGVSPAQAIEEAESVEERMMAEWYQAYEGLKGSGPKWRPPCFSKAYEKFMASNRPNDERLGDFDDMLGIMDVILKREPSVRKTLQSMFDDVIVDEAQDLNQTQFSVISQITEHVTDGKDGKSLWIVGDDKQCIGSDTPILLAEGNAILAKDLREGSSILAYRNGKLTSQSVRYVRTSGWTWGYKITTVGGKTLTMSPNHKIWATQPETPQGSVAVYLMYRNDMGFRVGVTNKGYCEDYLNSFGGRAFMEKAERMWFLDICPDRETALLSELRYSLDYGVPTAVFEGANRGLNQARIDAIFSEFGKNGARILEAKHLSFELPHWMSRSYSKHGRLRRTIQMIAHSSSNTQLALEWMGDDLDGVLKENSISYTSTVKGTKRIRKWFSNYREALVFAEKLQGITHANLQRRLSTDEGALQLLTASALFPGMSVAVVEEGHLVHEEIASIEVANGDTFLDIDVDDASNFVGGGILSHNSIYGFRGARPDMFTELNTTPGWKTKQIRTNYRCQPEIVDAANKLISVNQKQIPMEAVPSPAKPRHVGSIKVTSPQDDTQAAIEIAADIKTAISAGEDVANNAILTRTNAEQHSYETACIIRGIPYARKGASSFLGSPETKAFLSYVQLVTGDDHGKMQAALKEAINRPNRFFMTRPDMAGEAVGEAISMYARRTGQDVKAVNPVAALEDRMFLELLAEKLTGTKRGGFKFDKALERLFDFRADISNMRTNSSDSAYGTKDLFEDILGVRGVTSVTDPTTGKASFVDQTFRESLQKDLRNSTQDDDDDAEDDEEDEASSLGNVGFLFSLMHTDPTDEGDLLSDPGTPHGFKAKMERYANKARELRTDITKWDKEQEALPPEQRKPPPGVYIGTVHSVKGAQWRNCYVSMPKGKFPFEPPPKPGTEPPPIDPNSEEMESERRLGYVALTRAAMNLTIVCPKVVGGKAAGISPFVTEAGLSIGENVPKPGAPPGDAGEIKVARIVDVTVDTFPDELEPAGYGYDRRRGL